MRKLRYSILENLLIFSLLGIEAYRMVFRPFCSGETLPYMMCGYLILLLVYPLSKRQKANISKREAFLAIFMRWFMQNIGISFFIFCIHDNISTGTYAVHMLLLTGVGGISLYVILFVERLLAKWKRKGGMTCLFIYGKQDEKNVSLEDSIGRGLLKERSMQYDTMSAETTLSRMEIAISEYDRIYILDVAAERRNEIMKLCMKVEKPVYCISKISDVMIQGGYTVKNGDKPFFCCEKYRLSRSEAIVKRGFDIVCSCGALMLLWPLFLLIAVCIKLEDGGPVIYKQVRCTKDGREFFIYKFRSMIVDAEPSGARLAAVDDRRITKVGAILRNTKLDELPQLINILVGDMSIVGPRPERPEMIQKIRKDMPEFEFRTYVQAGLTGYAQVQGNYMTSPLDKLKWDLMYINQYSFILDLKIIAMTPFVIFSKNNRED